ncbi:MAG: hypothetical protein LBD77_03585, partial [Bifidobacteriaceae bacterium]|jgi:hypothetical protein|nr:hypothetical protein [Bifidobacteriaceae bacterium]
LALIGQASVWVEDSIADRSSIGFTQWIIQQALAASAPGQLELIVFDEALTGLSAPFEAVNSGGEKLMRVTHDQQEFKATLAYLRDHVQGVNNVMQGRADTLVEFRRAVNYPVEGYKLVVVSADVSALGEQLQDHLSVLLKAGPRAGISFLIHSMTLGANPFMVSMCDKYTVKHGEIRDDTGQALAVGWRPPGADQFIGTATAVARALASAELDSIAFDAVQALDKPWQASSADGVTCAIGRYGVSMVEITLGDELNQRHNMLVTGAVGQGKSNLISVIIHSLCQRYSPAELEFYLLDFKEGVTLQAFFDQRTGEYLPHARVLGLEADREFGLSVFRHLFGIYKERMRLFKAAGVQSIKKYREANPGAAMPRLILVIDEFQMMFAERDRVSDEIADLLVKGVRLFRACGIHVILASQTIGGNMSLMGSAGEGLFGQVPIRVALKNSLAESHATLGAKNEGAAHLRAREAIVNLDYGEVSANRKTSIAFADEAVLAPLRRGWWQAARERTDPPYVFVGERKHALVDDAAELRAAAASPAPVAFLGSRIEVGARPLALPLSRDLGRNIAFLGPGDAISEIASVAVSLAANRAGPAARFVVLDLAGADPAWQSAKAGLAAALAGLGCQVAFAGKAEVPEQVRELAALAGAGGGPEPVYVIGLGLDRCRDLPTDFQDLCRAGPPAGMHLLGSWLKLDSFQDQVGYGGAAYFDVKVAFRLDTQSARQFMNDPLLEWRPVENRMLVWDSAEMAEPIRAIPYAAFEPDRIAQALAEA